MKTITAQNYDLLFEMVKVLFHKKEYDLALETVYNNYCALFECTVEDIEIPKRFDRSHSIIIKRELEYILDRMKPYIQFVEN